MSKEEDVEVRKAVEKSTRRKRVEAAELQINKKMTVDLETLLTTDNEITMHEIVDKNDFGHALLMLAQNENITYDVLDKLILKQEGDVFARLCEKTLSSMFFVFEQKGRHVFSDDKKIQLMQHKNYPDDLLKKHSKSKNEKLKTEAKRIIAGSFIIPCQSGKIIFTQGMTHENRNRCRAICS